MKKFGLVVIGAHFGVWLNDELSRFDKENILLVEPVPYNHNKLKERFINSNNIQICTHAIFSEHKISKFYYVNEKSISKLGKHWASGIGSFDKQHILNHKNKRFKVENSDIEEIEIQYLTFTDLVNKYSITSIEMLQIDVEGAEYQILNSIDFIKISIQKIIFEFKHFDGTFKEGSKLKLIKEKLVNSNYLLTALDNENILAEKR